MKVALVICLALLVNVAGCGVYTLNPHGSSTFKTISIEPFENKTSEFAFTDRLTEIVIDAFIKEGTLKVVSTANADASLVGVLTRYERVPFKYDQNDQVQEYKIVMDFDVSLRNPKDQTNFWTERMTKEGIYRAADQTDEDGQRSAGEQLVQAILNKTTKSW